MKDKINYIQHNDSRKNNPTMENSKFFVEEERAAYPARYSRDRDLDPQLVWKGKDEQDREDLAVPTVPIYIQEKIQPAVIIEDLRKNSVSPITTTQTQTSMVADLFSDFNGIDSFEKEIEFYQHDKHWSNRMILGDSLLVMNSLAEKEGLKGKVQCIYLDPPYGIKFGSNWQVSTRKRDVKDGAVSDTAWEPEVIRAFRDTWQLGIHSYLSYLRDRLRVAQELLTDSGSIFVQIGDENVHLVRCLMDEVFGSENFVAQITFRKKLMPLGAKTLESMNDFLIWYAKSKDEVKYHQLYRGSIPDPRGRWTGVEENGKLRRLTPEEKKDFSIISPNNRIFSTISQWAPSFSQANVYDFEFGDRIFVPSKSQCWITSHEKLNLLGKIDRLFVEGDHPRYVSFHDDFPFAKITNPWMDTAPASDKTYVVQTNEQVIERCILMSTDPGDLVLDPTCGSGTTAYVAEQWGRRWITIDTSRVALALARTRLMAAKYPYYLLSDSPEGVAKESALSGHVAPTYNTGGDIKKGFVYERVPHVTLKSIANNPDIHEGMSREEIDRAIAKHADTELLYDKPYQDNKRIRVTGPFTVESLSPHRILPASEERPDSERDAQRDDTANDFVSMVLSNLQKAGVQNTKKGERLTFQTIVPHAGRWVQAVGTFVVDGKDEERVAISIGSEFGAVSPMQIKEAAKEAMQGLGHDVLVVCGYAFDPHVTDEAKQYGALTVLPTRITTDLQMSDELLKKTGAGNLFMVFGEPDLKVKQDNGKITVELLGLDIFDPTTGEIRNNSVDDIACWFIDTNYNGESFFVRHAYFTGAGEPYEKLKRALKAEIDESAWSSLYSNVSRPFDLPQTGKIAVKVINHYGDEVLKVFEV